MDQGRRSSDRADEARSLGQGRRHPRALALSDKAAVNPKAIEVEPIKTTGDFPAKAALHPEITASVFVKVVAE